MFTLQNNEITIRNLEEQVQYLTDLHEANKSLASWGIKVIGQVETAEELPNPQTYEGQYGDAYAVGLEAPFNFYIWTRSSIGDVETGYWFPFGEISIVGPEGPKGDKGDKGNTGDSSKIYAEPTSPQYTDYIKDKDIWIQTSGNAKGNLSQYNANANLWELKANIIGPQGPKGDQGLRGLQGEIGPKGEKGDRGDVGGLVNIAGILTSTDLLPTPAEVNNVTVAYLIGTQSPYDLWIQIGLTPQTSVWTNTGPFNVATMVTVGGEYQNIWDADTKLSFPPSASNYTRMPTVNHKGEQTWYNVNSETPTAGTIGPRTQRGTITTGIPSVDKDCVPLNWFKQHTPCEISLSIDDSGYWGAYSRYEFKIMLPFIPDTVTDIMNYMNAYYTFGDMRYNVPINGVTKFTGLFDNSPLNDNMVSFGTCTMIAKGMASNAIESSNQFTLTDVYITDTTSNIGGFNQATANYSHSNRIITNATVNCYWIK